jgi:hypothetical protein
LVISVHFLQNMLATVFLAYVLFIFAKATVVSRESDLLFAVVATVVAAGPICALCTFRLLGATIPQWLSLADDAIVGLIVRVGVVVLCFTLAVWSPWGRRPTGCMQNSLKAGVRGSRFR